MDPPQKDFPFLRHRPGLYVIKIEPSLNLTEALSCGSVEGATEVANGRVMSYGSDVCCVT